MFEAQNSTESAVQVQGLLGLTSPFEILCATPSKKGSVLRLLTYLPHPSGPWLGAYLTCLHLPLDKITSIGEIFSR